MPKNITLMGASYSDVPAITLPQTGGGTATFTDVTPTTATASDVATGKIFFLSNGTQTTGTASSGGSVTIKTGSATAGDNYPVSLSFTNVSAQPKAFMVRLTTQVSSSGSTTYYYIVDVVYDGTNTKGNCFRIGSTRRVQNVTSGYSWSYSGTTLTVTSSASSRSATPGAFYSSGTYELVYVY